MDEATIEGSQITHSASPTRLQDREWPTQKSLLLDSVRGIVLDPDQQNEFHNELNALHTLAVGLSQLFFQVASVERQLAKQHALPQVAKYVKTEACPPIACCFQWYAVSACNYAWLVGHVAHSARLIRDDPKTYRNDVAGPLVGFRNKVGAHFAKAGHDRRDNESQRLISVLSSHVSIQNGQIFVPIGTAVVKKKGDESRSDEVPPWSLTVAYIMFYRRYWSHPEDEVGDMTKVRPVAWNNSQFSMKFAAGGPGDSEGIHH